MSLWNTSIDNVYNLPPATLGDCVVRLIADAEYHGDGVIESTTHRLEKLVEIVTKIIDELPVDIQRRIATQIGLTEVREEQ
jgi:hypothetical protein